MRRRGRAPGKGRKMDLYKVKKWAHVAGSVVLGNFLLAFLVAAFVIPHGTVMGGATGVSLILNGWFSLDTAVGVFLVNVVMLLLGAVFLGKTFVISTVASSLLYPAFLSVLQKIPGIDAFTDDPLMAALLGGSLLGIALGLILRVGAATGGVDALNLILHKYTHIPVSVFVYVTDATIVLCQAFLYRDIENVLYGIVFLVLESLILNQVMLLGKAQIQIQVVSKQYEAIRRQLLDVLDAGVTMVSVETGFAGEAQKSVLSVIPSRKLYAAKEMILTIDPHAFMTITQVREVHGIGFSLERVKYLEAAQKKYSKASE